MPDKRYCILAVYMVYFNKYFTVDHNLLLVKIEQCEIDSFTITGIRNWLTSRIQHVVLNGTILTWREACSGVFQGSVLGPVFIFISYLDEIEGEQSE